MDPTQPVPSVPHLAPSTMGRTARFIADVTGVPEEHVKTALGPPEMPWGARHHGYRMLRSISYMLAALLDPAEGAVPREDLPKNVARPLREIKTGRRASKFPWPLEETHGVAPWFVRSHLASPGATIPAAGGGVAVVGVTLLEYQGITAFIDYTDLASMPPEMHGSATAADLEPAILPPSRTNQALADALGNCTATRYPEDHITYTMLRRAGWTDRLILDVLGDWDVEEGRTRAWESHRVWAAILQTPSLPLPKRIALSLSAARKDPTVCVSLGCHRHHLVCTTRRPKEGESFLARGGGATPWVGVGRIVATVEDGFVFESTGKG